MPRRARLVLLLPALAAALLACTQRPAPPPTPGEPQQPAAPAPAPLPVPPPILVPDAAPPPPAPAQREDERPERLADPERNAVLFTHWRSGRAVEVEAFENFLVYEKLARVVPTYQLLRSASMWKECRAEPFQLPPPRLWGEVRDVLRLLQELRTRGILPRFEVVSAYRPPALNRCAGGAPGSSHQRFAVDLAPLDDATAARLCRFWRQEGARWDMGVSRYPSGRVHIDRNGYRTWGASHGRGSSYCLR